MLAAAAEDAVDAFDAFEDAIVEDKLDGIRAQVHVSEAAGCARIFSRTRDDVTASFPELEPRSARCQASSCSTVRCSRTSAVRCRSRSSSAGSAARLPTKR